MLTYMDLMLHIIPLSNEMKPSVFRPLEFIGWLQFGFGVFFSFVHKYEFHRKSKKTLRYEIKCMLPLQMRKKKRKKKTIMGFGCLNRPII